MIIIVVYIPNNTEYYNGVFDVFKTCLKSLQTTINNHARIMVVNNGSTSHVMDFINDELKNGNIASVIHHKQNIGKMDALIGAARSCREELITITDTDILFTTGWQEAVEEVFENFPKAGSVSPIPIQHDSLFAGTHSLLFDILQGKLKLKKIPIPENFEDHNLYLESVNWPPLQDRKIKWPVAYCNGQKAVVSSGHQVMTVRREIFIKYSPTNPSRTLVGGDSEHVYGDQPIDMSGLWRLSTLNNYAYHMGNTLEPWMLDKLKTNKKISTHEKNKIFNDQKDYNFSSRRIFFFKLKKKIVKWYFKRKVI